MKKLCWVFRIAVAAILLQTLFFKFSGAPESVYIFLTLHAEPWGRWGSGVVELIASLLILWPRTQILGALTAMGVMAGAILSHIFVLGLVVMDDGGQLFGLAVTVFVCSALVVILQRDEAKAQILGILRPVLRAKNS